MSTTPLPHTPSLFSLRSQGETTPSLPAGFRNMYTESFEQFVQYLNTNHDAKNRLQKFNTSTHLQYFGISCSQLQANTSDCVGPPKFVRSGGQKPIYINMKMIGHVDYGEMLVHRFFSCCCCYGTEPECCQVSSSISSAKF